jgi:hypothetical protein
LKLPVTDGAIDMSTKTIFSELTLMLLGSRKKVRLRHRIKDTLVKKGYAEENIVIMEDIKDGERYLNEKFGSILDKYTPRLFFAFFHKGANMDGVIFELGWICGKYNPKEISERLRIVSELDYNWKNTTRYI